MSQDGPQADDWHWLWDVYIVGGCLVGVAAVVLLNDRSPGNMPVAIAALTGIIVCTLTFGRRVIGTKGFTWPSVVFIALMVGLFVFAYVLLNVVRATEVCSTSPAKSARRNSAS
jgi:hypothetical protein